LAKWSEKRNSNWWKSQVRNAHVTGEGRLQKNLKYAQKILNHSLVVSPMVPNSPEVLEPNCKHPWREILIEPGQAKLVRLSCKLCKFSMELRNATLAMHCKRNKGLVSLL